MAKKRCTKVRYPNENLAIMKLASMWKRLRCPRRKFTERYAYKCRRCGGWHLTSEDPV